MNVLENPHEAFYQLDFARREGKRIGLIPTMGGLHDGHLTLVRHAKQQCDLAVATIFVNPSQFGPNEDFTRYPRTLDSDLEKLDACGCDVVFTPSIDVMYPPGFSTYVEPPKVAARWEGECRPGHFRGVATIVLKLFQMLPADVGFFGSKDYQQVAVLTTMVRDLDVPIRIEACETVRDADGLAMSSRNRYLSPDERARALALYRSLKSAQCMVDAGTRDAMLLEQEIRRILQAAPVDSIDYAAIVDVETMEPLARIESSAVAIMAVRIGTTRLIDNLVLQLK